ncbi:MAG: BatD family protein [Sphingobacteriales bacterium]|jgi:hypothetical protein
MSVLRPRTWGYRLSLLLVCLLAGMLVCKAQYLTLSTDRKDILLGEQFTLTIKLTSSPGKVISGWPLVPDSINHLEVISRGTIDSTREGNKIIYSQAMVMTGFDSGHWVIPPMGVNVDGKEVTSTSTDINVQSIKLEGSEYNDVKEIIEVPPPGPEWKSILLYAFGILLLLLLLYFWRRNRKKKPVVVKPVSKGTAYDQAMKALEALRKEQLVEKGEMKKFYSGLYDIFREYGSALSGSSLMQSTTDDVLISMKGSLEGSSFSKLAEVLRISDAVKFAKYGSSKEEASESFTVVKESIDLLNKKKV